MRPRNFSSQNIYLRSAGLVSALLGFLAAISFFLSFAQDLPAVKWPMFFFGIVGIVVSYIIGRDVLDRFKNRELIADGVPIQQVRLAQIGIRFMSALWFFAIGLILAYLLFWLILYQDELNIVGLICSNSLSLQSCINSFWR